MQCHNDCSLYRLKTSSINVDEHFRDCSQRLFRNKFRENFKPLSNNGRIFLARSNYVIHASPIGNKGTPYSADFPVN